MLDAALQNQLKTYLENVREPIELVPSSDDSAKSREMAELLAEIAALSDKVSVAAEEANERSPSFAIRRTGTDIALRFAQHMNIFFCVLLYGSGMPILYWLGAFHCGLSLFYVLVRG